jgi:cytochrome c553
MLRNRKDPVKFRQWIKGPQWNTLLGRSEKALMRIALNAALVLGAFWVLAVAQNPEAQNQGGTTRAVSLREPPPYWAFALNPTTETSNASTKTPDTAPRHVPESDAAFTLAQITDFFNPPDWHPTEHPAMPDIVSRGRAPAVYACGYCHLPNGQGRPENASLAGLPAAYIVQQLADFKSGLRKSSEPKHAPTSAMIANETEANEKEVQAAAEYFSALEPKPWIRVVEADTVPRTHVAGWMLVLSDGGETEPIGQRIIETPENLERTELRDDRSGFIAYVPVGSIKRGEALASGASSKTLGCATCHGRDLQGKGKVPSLAGRSPSYVVRQLYDIQHGARTGAANHPMKPVVANLAIEDMIAIAAYTASLRP